MATWLTVGLKLLPLIVSAVNAVERIVKGGAHGKDKQDAAVDLVTTMVESIEGLVNKDLLDDAQVQVALRATIDAIVAMQNAMAAARATRTATPSAPPPA